MTVYGKLGVKCWICKGENKPEKAAAAASRPARCRCNRRELIYSKRILLWHCMPARVKYRKMHRGSRTGTGVRAGSTVAFGEYGLMALERCWLDTKQIEAARVAITRNMKRHGKLWIRIFPQKSFTKKPLETRMGKGKGPLESLGGGHPSGERVVRSGRRDGSDGARIHAPGGDEAADQDQIYFPAQYRGKRVMKLSIRNQRCDAGGIGGQEPRPAPGNVQPAPAAGQRQLEKPARLRTLRNDIARVETRISAIAARKRHNNFVWLKQQHNRDSWNAATARNASAKSSPTR